MEGKVSKTNITILDINEDIVKSVAKKIITNTSSKDMPFSSLTMSVSKRGYGFTVSKNKYNRLSLRAGDKLSIHIGNETLSYNQSFLISDIGIESLSPESVLENYKKYCINAAYTLYKRWIFHPDNSEPDLGTYYTYKY